MSHLLRPTELTLPRYLLRPHVAVRVRLVKMRPRQLEVDPDPDKPLVIVRDVELVALPPDVQVLADGEVVEATGRFFITTETLDPYHLLIDDHQGVVR